MRLRNLVVMLAIAIFGFTAAVALAGNDKVTICHKPDNQAIELEVGDPAVQAHLDHGDTLGPCDDGGTTTNPPPPPPPTGGGGGSSSGVVLTGPNDVGVYCDFDHYVVVGMVDGQAADSATPATIPGNYRGYTNVTLHRGDTDWRTAVFTYGDCLGR